MDLVAGEKTFRRNAERFGHAGAVLGDLGGGVLGADAAVEALVQPLRHAAGAGEEAVADSGEPGERWRLQHGVDLRHRREARQDAKRRMGDANSFEQRAHLGAAFAEQPLDRAVDLGRLFRGASALSDAARFSMPRLRRNSAWAMGPSRPRPCFRPRVQRPENRDGRSDRLRRETPAD